MPCLLRVLPLALLLFAALPVHAFSPEDQPEAASGTAQKRLVKAPREMVVAAHPLAAEAGLRILKQGGSAIDAGIAVQLVLNLVEPQSSGIGGGAFLLYWHKDSQTLAGFDGRETAPMAADENLFMAKDGKPLAFEDAVASGRSIGTPGVLAALWMAHEKYGKLPWKDLFQPAIEIAGKGFPVSRRLHTLLAEMGPDGFTAAARAYFFETGGEPLPAGYVLKNPVFAATLRKIAEDGPDAFYKGPLAKEIAAAAQSDPRAPGKLAIADLAAYRAKLRPPACAPYRRLHVCGAGLPSSGGITVGQILQLAEPFDLGARPFAMPAMQIIADAERLAFADRDKYLADSDFIHVPVKGLLDARYLGRRRKLITPGKRLPEALPGTPPGSRQGFYGKDATKERHGTSHISIVDRYGNALSMTTSIEQAFGARTMVGGFLLNNELTDFSFRPKDDDGTPIANRVQPGKRPRSSMDPTIVFSTLTTSPDRRKLRYVLGSPGGPAIILFNAKAVFAMVNWGLDPQQAAALANFGAIGNTVLLETDPALDSLAGRLGRMGYKVKRGDLTSGLHIIAVTPDGLEGGADPRRDGVALGD